MPGITVDTRGFDATFRQFTVEAERRARAVFVAGAELTLDSIVHGSSVTGAPGQPVAQGGVPHAGKLRDSWTLTYPEATSAEIASDVPYAGDVEDNLFGAHFHSGGPHSVKLTAVSFDRLVDQAAVHVVGANV